LINKSKLIDRLQYDLIRFLDHFGVAYFLGPPCMIIYRITVLGLTFYEYENLVLFETTCIYGGPKIAHFCSPYNFIDYWQNTFSTVRISRKYV